MKPITMTVQWLLLEICFSRHSTKFLLYGRNVTGFTKIWAFIFLEKNCCCPNETITEKTNW